jgi:hypothetical protein
VRTSRIERVGRVLWPIAVNAIDWAISKRAPGVDFFVFHQAARRFMGGSDLYPATDGQLAYKYAPGFALLFVPFAWMPLRAGWAAFNLVSAACITLATRWTVRRLVREPGIVLPALVIVAVYPMVVQLFRIGQVDALLLALIVASEALAPSWPRASGLLWATATVAKTPFAILAVPALAHREWRRLAAFAAGCVAWLAVGFVPWGVAGGVTQLDAWRDLLRRSTPPLFCYQENQSIFGIACKLAGAGAHDALRFYGIVAILAVILASAAVAASVALSRHDRVSGRVLGFAAGLYLAAALSPLGWRSTLVVAIPLLCLAAALARHGGARRVRLVAAGSFVVLLGAEYGLPALLSRVTTAVEQRMLQLRSYGVAYAILALGTFAAAALQRSSGRKLFPTAAGTPKNSETVAPRSAKLSRIPSAPPAVPGV